MAVALVGTVPVFADNAAGVSIPVTRTGIVAGNLIAIGVGMNNSGPVTITNVSDGTTTVSVPDVTLDIAAFSQTIAFFSFPNHTSGDFTFTANFSGSATARHIYCVELSGAHLTTPLDGIGSATGTSATPSSGNLSPAPAVNGEYILGFTVTGVATTVGSGFTLLGSEQVFLGAWVEGLAQATAAPIAADWSIASGPWGAIGASYKPTVGGATNQLAWMKG